MGFFKKVRKKPFFTRLIARAIHGYVQFVWYTSRWEYHNKQVAVDKWKAKKPAILLFWHARLLMMLKAWLSDQKCHILMSSHSDGEFIARAAQLFGFDWVKGSSNRRGAQAMRDLLHVINERSETVAITPDGPRGPRYSLKVGPIVLSRMTGTEIYPVAYSVKRAIVLRSWDRFFFPLPFNRGVFVYGDPIYPSPSQTDEEFRQEVEKSLNAATRLADQLCGWGQQNPGELPEDTDHA